MKSRWILLHLSLLLAVLSTAVRTIPVTAQSSNTVTAADLIALVNGIRTANGLPALEVNSILMAAAQGTADIMAANRMTWHIGDVRGRLMAAGYGGGAVAWATENFAIGPMSIQDIAWIWSDADHMIPMVKPAYQHIGAGVATAADGSVYYIVQAAYTSGSPLAKTKAPGSTGKEPTAPAPQFIIPVTTSTPDAAGQVVHEVRMGQSLWSIAIAYNTHIVDILRTNRLSPDQQVVWIGQKLSIPVTPQPLTPTVEPTSTPAVTRTPVKIAAVVTTKDPVAIKPSASQPSPTPAQPIPTKKAPSPPPVGGDTIGYILAGVFAAGVVMIGFGLFTRRSRL